MAYDEDLANRVREALAEEAGVTEKAMFGGLAFLVGGNMSVAVSGQGGLLVRVAPEASDAVLELAHTQPMRMRGREMRGWIRVAPAGLGTQRTLDGWVRRGIEFARTLPVKGAASSARRSARTARSAPARDRPR